MKRILIISLIIMLLFIITGCAEDKIETRDIKGLQLTSETTAQSSGTFILGIGVYGSYEDTKTYYYTYIMGKEGFRLQKIDSDNVEIVETNDVKPSIKGVFYLDGSIQEIIGDYVIYVPVGTIFEEYKAKI